ncbi:unnamed protein product [Rhodiola kirilowii]
MPDTRISTMTDALAALSQTVADLGQRQLEETTQLKETMLKMMERMDHMQSDMQGMKAAEIHADKQPIGEGVTSSNANSPPLLPTPQPTHRHVNSSYNNTPYQPRNPEELAVTHHHDSMTGGGRAPRIDVPQFSGDDVDGWAFQMKRYFEYHRIPNDQKLTVASFYLYGEALKWYQWLYTTNALTTWTRFSQETKARFGPPAYYHAETLINQLCQTTTVAAYIKEFEELSSRAPGLNTDNLLHRFLAGLKVEIHTELVLLSPANLRLAMGMARVAEKKVNITKSWCNRVSQTRYSPPLTYVDKQRPQPHTTTGRTGLPIKRLIPTEMAVRREKGLCFNCDEQFRPGHKCKPKFLCMLMEEDDDPLEDELEQPPITEEQTEEPPTISFHAMQGRTLPRTLRLKATLAGRQVLVLIDGGSTHNFVQTRVAKNAGLTVETAKHLSVTVGNGEELRCEGMSRDVQLTLGGKIFHADFYLLPIYGADVVLGAQWLADVGPVMFDYKELWLSLDYEGETLKLQGIQPVMAQFSALTLGQFKRAQYTDSLMSLYQLTITEIGEADLPQTPSLPYISDELPLEQSQSIALLVSKYAKVFGEPTNLPPSRSHDHRIPLIS